MKSMIHQLLMRSKQYRVRYYRRQRRRRWGQILTTVQEVMR